MIKLLALLAVLATADYPAESDDFDYDREPPPRPSWDDDGFGPGGPEGAAPFGRDDYDRGGGGGFSPARFDRVPPPRPEPHEGWLGPHRDAWIVGGVATIPCLVLLLLLLRESTRGRREVTTKLSLLASVSHEFRTPLTNLKLYAELLENTPQLGAEERAKYLRIISEETARLTRLVDNVLDYGRLVENRHVYAMRELDLPRLVRDIAAKQQDRLQAAGMSLEVLGEEELTARGDADAIRQVVNNLIDNAVKYAAEGRMVSLLIGSVRGAPYIDVADHGPGVDRRDVKHLFNRFWRADRSLASGASGAGLGLDIARGLMRGMGGDLVYRDNPEGGSIFRAVFHG